MQVPSRDTPLARGAMITRISTQIDEQQLKTTDPCAASGFHSPTRSRTLIAEAISKDRVRSEQKTATLAAGTMPEKQRPSELKQVPADLSETAAEKRSKSPCKGRAPALRTSRSTQSRDTGEILVVGRGGGVGPSEAGVAQPNRKGGCT